MRGITFNGKHSIKDFGLYVESLDISPPKKIKIKESVPFMSGFYDFSLLYGSNPFEERTLRYSFEVLGDSQCDLNILKTQINNWLMSNGQVELEDDAILGFYFLAECTEINENDERDKTTLSVTFLAYPFKIGKSYEGNNLLWDSFNFELDVLQDTKFTVSGSSSVNIHNPSIIDIKPTIMASSQFEIVLDNKKYTVGYGTSKDYRFKFKPGNNNLILKGNGTIEFRFRKEVL